MKLLHIDSSILGAASVSLASGKKVIIASARGGAYANTPIAFLDHQESYLAAVFNFVGITDITFHRAENVARPDLREQSIAAARAEIAALAPVAA